MGIAGEISPKLRRAIYAFVAAGQAPSCCIREKRFATPQCSVNLPLHSHDIDGFKVDLSTGRRQTQECSLRSMMRFERRQSSPSTVCQWISAWKSGNAARRVL